MKLVNFKADEADYIRWKQRALSEGMTFGEWARRNLNMGIVANNLVRVVIEKVPEPPKPARATRSLGCEHRLPKGTYCKPCGKIKR